VKAVGSRKLVAGNYRENAPDLFYSCALISELSINHHHSIFIHGI
jgi:hypothetical protein